MQRPALPLDESRRVESLFALKMLDTPAEERFDRITRVARRLFGVRAAGIALVDTSRVWFKAMSGLDLPQVARDVSFCGHAILHATPLIVADTAKDARFFDNPLVLSPPNIRFYAGHPLMSEDGSAIGTLSLFDPLPGTEASFDIDSFSDVARIAESELRATSSLRPADPFVKNEPQEQRVDPLTRLWSRSAVVELLRRELEMSGRTGAPVGVLLADVDHLRRFNEARGVYAGDAALCEVARRLRLSIRPYDSVGRLGGEEFLVVLPSTDAATSCHVAERIRAAVTSGETAGELPLTISIGVASQTGGSSDPEHLIREAERALRQAKSGGGNRVDLAGDR